MNMRSLVWVGLVAIAGCASGRADTERVALPAPVSAVGSVTTESAPEVDPSDTPEPPAALPAPVRAWWPEIVAAAEPHRVSPELVALVVWLESNGEPTAVSPTGARGLMQLMPATATKLAQARGEPPPTPTELLDPQRSLELGCAHLAALGVELGITPTATALDGADVHRLAIAYNGGSKVLSAWERGEALPIETERYSAALRERWEAIPR